MSSRVQAIAVIAAALVVAAVIGVYALVVEPQRNAAAASAAATADPATPFAVPSNPRAAFIGDSYTAGTGATDPGYRWTTLVAADRGWQEANFGLGGTGYVNTAGKAGCGMDFCPAYPGVVADVVKAGPDVVIVSGGRNDRWKAPSDVEAAADKLFSGLRAGLPKARVFVTTPIWDDDPAPAAMGPIRDAVKAAATAHGVAVLDIGEPLLGHRDAVIGDGVHPDNAGHALIAKAVEKALTAAGA